MRDDPVPLSDADSIPVPGNANRGTASERNVVISGSARGAHHSKRIIVSRLAHAPVILRAEIDALEVILGSRSRNSGLP